MKNQSLILISNTFIAAKQMLLRLFSVFVSSKRKIKRYRLYRRFGHSVTSSLRSLN